MTTNNVIAFPKKNERIPDIDGFKDKMENAFAKGKIRQAHALEATQLFETVFLEHLAMAGFNLDNQSTIKDLSLVMVALKAYIMKYYGLHHPLQPLSEELFYVRRSTGDIVLRADKIQHIVQPEPEE